MSIKNTLNDNKCQNKPLQKLVGCPKAQISYFLAACLHLIGIKEVLDFLTANKVFYLATTSGDQPHVRPMGFIMEYDGKLAFCTSNQKDMYKQLAANYNPFRICGKAVFFTTEETQWKALEVMPALGKMYAVGDGTFEIFCLDNAQAVNEACTKLGGVVGIKCSSIGGPERHKGCLANQALASQRATYSKNQSDGKTIIDFWIPVVDHPDIYVHFGIGTTIDYDKC